ncbi:MAG: MFS transporter [Clostridiales bacterium]|jgi:oligogalacturonide transporter|nr:MFS transporter [Clostridiales bacterium]
METENKTAEAGANYAVKLSAKERFLFSIGDFNAGAFGLVLAVYTVFLYANSLTASAAGIIVMIGRVWGAAADPIVGILSDNTRGKHGRRRPYIFAGGIFIVFAFAMLFLPLYDLPSQTFKFIIYLAAYLMFSTVSSMLVVPCAALATEITADHDERNKINTLRTVISFLSSIVSAGVPIILTEALQDKKISVTAFSLIMIFVFGAMYAVPTVLSAVYAKERLPVPAERTRFSLKAFFAPLKQKSFVYLVIIYAATLACADLVGSEIILMAEFGLDIDFSAFSILGVMMFFLALMIPVHGRLMKKHSKAFLFRAGIPFYIAGVILLCFYPPDWNDYFLFAVAAAIGVGMAGCQLMPWYIFPDVVDLGELKTGTRNAGAFSGLMTFMQKLLSAVLIGLAGIILDASGFLEPAANADGIVAASAQPESAIIALRFVVAAPLVVALIISFFVAAKLKTSPERSRLVTKILALKRTDRLDELTDGESAEYERIKKECL